RFTMPFVSLAIVGAGPSCTYALERLAALAQSAEGQVPLAIHIFDASGQFGAGQVHSPEQPATSFLNRIVGQVSFAADETVEEAGPLLPAELRPTLLEWCHERFRATGDPLYDVSAEDWPKRYVHGQALQDQFETYLRLLRSAGVRVDLHHAEVVDIHESAEGDNRLTVVTNAAGASYDVDSVLMVTGHSWNDPDRYPKQAKWNAFAKQHGAVFVPSAYPMELHIPEASTGPGSVVGCLGMGLTSIDIILHLTEGRGGTYVDRGDGQLLYVPSGDEPASIAVFSRSGLFTFARPYNAKERDLDALEHRGVFLTEAAVDALRVSQGGTPVTIGGLARVQLDFERHVLPVVVLEMAALYYRTLFGPEFGAALEAAVRPEYEAFLADAGAGASSADAVARLSGAVERYVDPVAEALDAVLRGGAAELPKGLLGRYLEVVFGPDSGARLAGLAESEADRARFARAVEVTPSPYRHGTYAADNRFSWERTLWPIPRDGHRDGEGYRAALLDFLDVDHRWAAQDNLTNPAKAAADGVWRDLRDTLAYAVDFGGLTAASHQNFLDVYMRHHNRLCNGAALEVMEKVRAAIRAGLVDVSVGPGADLTTDAATGRFRVQGPTTGADVELDVLVDSRVHPFDAENDVRPVYPALLRHGLVHKWVNPGQGGAPDFGPGGLELTADFHPVRGDGTADARLTFLGPPSEGVMFFQLGALRPNRNHHVMQDVLRWVREFWPRVQDAPVPASA
ncbi:FAD/NAD(P)-binding protein, partial [Streptomyces acidiscabies]